MPLAVERQVLAAGPGAPEEQQAVLTNEQSFDDKPEAAQAQQPLGLSRGLDAASNMGRENQGNPMQEDQRRPGIKLTSEEEKQNQQIKSVTGVQPKPVASNSIDSFEIQTQKTLDPPEGQDEGMQYKRSQTKHDQMNGVFSDRDA